MKSKSLKRTTQTVNESLRASYERTLERAYEVGQRDGKHATDFEMVAHLARMSESGAYISSNARLSDDLRSALRDTIKSADIVDDDEVRAAYLAGYAESCSELMRLLKSA